MFPSISQFSINNKAKTLLNNYLNNRETKLINYQVLKTTVHALRCKEFKSAWGYISQKVRDLHVLSFPVAGSKYS